MSIPPHKPNGSHKLIFEKLFNLDPTNRPVMKRTDSDNDILSALLSSSSSEEADKQLPLDLPCLTSTHAGMI